MLPKICGAAAGLGKWRYFLTGLPLAVLFGMAVHALGKLAEPFGMWCRFSGTVETNRDENGSQLLCVRFQDRSRMTHAVSFRTAYPAAKHLQAGDPVSFAMRRELFTSGNYTQDDNAPADGVLLCAEHRSWLRRTLLHTLLRELLLCGAALAVFLLAMHFCYSS